MSQAHQPTTAARTQAQAAPVFDVSDLGHYSLAEMLEVNAHDEEFCEWARSCAVGDVFPGIGEPCVRVA